LTVEQLGQVRVVGRAAPAGAAAADDVWAVAAATAAGATAGATPEAVGGAAVEVVVVVAVLVGAVLVSAEVAAGAAAGGTDATVAFARVERLPRRSTNATSSRATMATIRTKSSQGKPLEDEGVVVLVVGPELLPVAGWPGTTVPGVVVSTGFGTTPLGTALGTCEVLLGGGAVVAWAAGLLVVAATPDAESTPAKTKTARARLNRAAMSPKRLRKMLLFEFDVERMNEIVTPPGVFEPHQAQARRLLYQVKRGMHKGQ
jgi:hypothetical protein